MSKGLKIALGITGVGLIGYAFYRYITNQTQLLKNFTYSIVGASLSNLSLKNVSANITVRLNNISNVEIEVEQMYLDVYINQVKVGYFQDAGLFTIPANGYTDIPTSVEFDPTQVISGVLQSNIFSGGIKDIQIGVRGYAQAKSSFLKVTLPIKYDSTIGEIMSSR